MIFEKKYVRRDDPDNPFKDDTADWVECENCGQALLVVPGAPGFCNGSDSAGCSPEMRGRDDAP